MVLGTGKDIPNDKNSFWNTDELAFPARTCKSRRTVFKPVQEVVVAIPFLFFLSLASRWNS